MLTTEYIIEKLERLLPIYVDTYSSEEAKAELTATLEIYVNGAVVKLEQEGIPNVFTEETAEADNYVICVSYQVALDMDIGVDYDLYSRKYLTRVNTLRNYANQVDNNTSL